MGKAAFALAMVILIATTVFALADESSAQSAPDARYGVVAHRGLGGNAAHFLDSLGVTWHHDYSSDALNVPRAKKS